LCKLSLIKSRSFASKRVTSHLTVISSTPPLDAIFSDYDMLPMAVVASIAGKIAFGPNQGNYVRNIGKGFGYEGEIPLAKRKRCKVLMALACT
jgi:hypothetical protein